MKLVLIIITFFFYGTTFAQKDYAKIVLDSLCSERFAGRGYVDNGVGIAADFIIDELKSNGVSAFKRNPYKQDYSFGVNTFPYPIEVKLGDSILEVGQDYLLNANSGTAQGVFKTVEYNSSNFYRGFVEPVSSEILIFNFTDLKNKDSISYFYQLASQSANYAPVVWVTDKKMMYSVGRKSMNYPMITLDSKAFKSCESISLKINNKYISSYKNSNVIAYIPPAKKCKIKPTEYIVLSAHYDHLGKMGQAMFPGANDNASGVAMVLSMAKYYKENPSEYGIVLCFFSGEEAGLVGSEYFVNHPYFKLKKIKFQLNIDIMGGASTGITLVNGSVLKDAFNLMEKINTEKEYLPVVKKRGTTANSDHHHFTESGVPAFFIYSMGTVMNYHDINDKAENTPLTNFDEVQSLLIEFVEKINF
jgi:hypothetical protein